MHKQLRWWVLGTLVFAVAIGALVGVALGQPKRGVEVVRELAIPPGRYSAIVLGAHGGKDSTSWAAYLVLDSKTELPLIVRGGETLVLPFATPWTVSSSSPVTIRISPDAPTYLLWAWGITDTGPVPFAKTK